MFLVVLRLVVYPIETLYLQQDSECHGQPENSCICDKMQVDL